MISLSEFKKTKDFLICVDSDGCAMDTMDIKHFKCFGPCMVTEWKLEEWQDEILRRWNEVNLYTMTRGINRFKGLSLALSEVNDKFCTIEGVNSLAKWVEESPELSNVALEREIESREDNEIFKKALSWSKAVNEKIKSLPESEIKPFKKAREALEFAHTKADVAIVSSANLNAVLEEWERHGLLAHVDIVLTQNDGSKAFCIGELIKKGYSPENILMCGDASGDMQSAEKNGVYFYPILVRKETESWVEFIDEGFERFINNSYGGKYQESKISQFLNNLGGNKNG